MTFSKHLIKKVVFWLKFHWSLFLRIKLKEIGIGSGHGLAPTRRQAITWKNAVNVTYAYMYHRLQWVSSSTVATFPWWRHQMETFSALLAICAGNSPVTGEFPAQRPLTRSFDVFFDLHPNKRLSKQWWGWWFESPSRPLWRHCNVSLLNLLWLVTPIWRWTCWSTLVQVMVYRQLGVKPPTESLLTFC